MSLLPRVGFLAVFFALTSSIAQSQAHSTTPVLLVNGYQSSCANDGGVSGTFDQLPRFLLEDGAAFVDFFDECIAPGSTIEHLATLLTAKLQSYSGPVDVIAHSMGGLVVRAYLEGWTDSPFLNPPFPINIDKLIFLGTPHSGVSTDFAGLSAFFGTFPAQVAEMEFGSPFVWNLGTWNQSRDDLRGVDALAVAGSAGITTKGVPWDGVVDLASASLDFSRSGVQTRVIPYCHTQEALVALLLCALGAPDLAYIDTRSHLSYQLIRSFLDGDNAWQTIAPQASSMSSTGGLTVGLSDNNGNFYNTNQISSVVIADGQNTNQLSDPGWFPWFNDGIPAASDYVLSFVLSGQNFTVPNVTVPAGGFTIRPIKFPPVISLVVSAAAVPPGSLSVTADSLISIYGQGLSSSTAQPSGYPWPFTLADVSVTVAGQPSRLTYASSGQVNALVPAGLVPGLYPLKLMDSLGQHSVNIMIEEAVPTLFSFANNAAAALDAITGQVISTLHPATTGEYVSLYATGLGPTTIQNGLNVASIKPSVFVDGIQAPVEYAGRSPQYAGLDQINIQIPQGTRTSTSVPVVIVSGTRASNSALLAVN